MFIFLIYMLNNLLPEYFFQIPMKINKCTTNAYAYY